MTTFYLIRHGNKKNQPGNLGLSDFGETQAEFTANHVKKLSINAIYSSPYIRAKETAQIISRTLNLPVIEEDLLKERMNWDSESQSFEEFIQKWEYATHNSEFKPNHGYSVNETAERLNSAMKKIAYNAKNQHIVLVTHGGTIRDFLAMLSKKYRNIFAKRKMEGVQECSITKILYDKDKIEVEYFDNIDHLKPN